MIEMSVQGIAIDARSAQPIVVLKDKDTVRTLPIWIGVAEARAISFALEKAKSKRPLTHELLLSTIVQLGYKVKQVEINKLGSDAYSATIKLTPLHAGGKRKLIDARPSDAIALALAAKAPIFAAPEIIVSVNDDDDDDDAEEFKRFVEGLKASDFKIPGISIIAPIEDDNTPSSEEPTSSQLPDQEKPKPESSGNADDDQSND